jgi:hypothetical protein
MSIPQVRRLSVRAAVVRAAVVGAVVALGFLGGLVPSRASAATCGTATASATQDGLYNYTYKGSAVGMCTTWTYSWHIELLMQRGGDCDTDDRLNFGGTTSTSTPTYSGRFCDPRVFGSYGCAHFRLHHGTSNSSPLVDEGIGCSQGAPAFASQLPGLLTVGEAGTPAEEAAAAQLRMKAAARNASAAAALTAP